MLLLPWDQKFFLEKVALKSNFLGFNLDKPKICIYK